MRTLPALTFLGGASTSGSYVLRIRLASPVELAFGRFKGGKRIALEPGEYADIGSALGRRGSVSLGRRLVRHASRTGVKPPHPIRSEMLERFPSLRLGANLLPANGKNLFWNVDHLLDRDEATLTAAIVIRSDARMEREIGQLLERDTATVVFERGLGANDVPGNTHILRVDADEAWWVDLPKRLDALRCDLESNATTPLD